MADYTGSFSGSFTGNGNGLTNIDYYGLGNLPTTITPFQKNSILANNSVRDNFVSNVKVRLNAENVISASAQLIPEFDIRYGNELGDDLISGSAQVKSLLPSGVISGSEQLPTGLVSGSSQVDVTSTTNYSLINQYSDGKVKTKLNTESVLSGSLVAQLPSGTISGSSQVDYDNILNKPTTITVSQKNAIVANTAKVGYTDSAVKSKLNTENVLSGSISFSNVTNKPNGLVSSSAQVIPVGTISSSAQIAGLGYLTSETDSQTLTYVGDTLTISNGNSVTIPTGSDLPAGTISGSAQIAALGYLTSQTDAQQLTLSGNNLSISNGNSVSLAGLGGGGSGGSSIWNTGSQDPSSYTHLITSNNLKVTGSVDIKGDFTVNGQSVFTQTSASDAGNALVVKGRIKVLEEQIGSYIASASMQVGNSQDTIDCGGFF